MELKAFEPSTDVFPLPGHLFNYVRPGGTHPHGTFIPYGVPLIQPAATIKALWRDLPADILRFDGSPTNWQLRLFGGPLETPKRLPYIGAINNAPMFGLPRWSLLLTEVRPIPRPAVVPQAGLLPISYDVEFMFKYAPQTHLYYMYSGLADKVSYSGYYQVNRGATFVDPATGTLADTDSVFVERDFTKLFQAGGPL